MQIQSLLLGKVNEWRGVHVEPTELLPDFIRVNISVPDEVTNVVASDTTVFVIARDSAQPSPPIAVARRRLGEFPTIVVLSDRDAMIPGRPLSAFASVEIIARISLAGSPIAQAGDWFGSIVVDRMASQSNDLAIDLEIDQVVH